MKLRLSFSTDALRHLGFFMIVFMSHFRDHNHTYCFDVIEWLILIYIKFERENCFTWNLSKKCYLLLFYQYISSNVQMAVKLNDVLTWMKNISKKKNMMYFFAHHRKKFHTSFSYSKKFLVLVCRKIRNSFITAYTLKTLGRI